MSRDKIIEPEEVVREVDHFVSKCHHDVETSSNVTLLDSGQVYSLHLLAASVYGTGYRDGTRSEAARHDGERQREFDARQDGRNAVQRIALARKALLDLGYFTDTEVGDDVAPRITEVNADVIRPLLIIAATFLNKTDDPEDPMMADAGVNPHLANMIHRMRKALAADAIESLG